MGGCESHEPDNEFRLDHIVAEIKALTTLELLPIPQELRPTNGSGFEFALLSYNLKNDWLVSPIKALSKYDNYKQSIRCKRVIEKLKIYCPDIIFLQECTDTNLYRSQLEAIGYATFAAVRKNLMSPEGLIIAARRTIFKIYETKVIEFDRSQRARNNSSYQTGHIALVAKFEHLGSGKIVNVINASFYSDQQEEHLQYHQMSELMKFINEEFREDSIVVWGGNIEATPYGNILEYVQNRKPPRHIDKSSHVQMNQMFQEMEKMDPKISWDNSYRFYGKAMGSGTEYPKFTYSNGSDQLVVDHLFYSTNTLFPESLLAINDDLNEDLPNMNNPSNHVPIMANFEILK